MQTELNYVDHRCVLASSLVHLSVLAAEPSRRTDFEKFLVQRRGNEKEEILTMEPTIGDILVAKVQSRSSVTSSQAIDHYRRDVQCPA